jgi:hypothetical protein
MDPMHTPEHLRSGEVDTFVFASDDGVARRSRRRREGDRMKAPSTRGSDALTTQRRAPMGQRPTISLRDC